MKKNFLIIATLAGLSTIASAASTATDSAILVLPTYVVTAPRFGPAEQKVNSQLKDFIRQSEVRQALKPDLNLISSRAESAIRVTHAAAPAAKAHAKS
ncbi:MAG: hypothetical protein QG602_2910 [Verrucomicrobiota bacterium]|nr:hypothetical protein [Verrucomicrobiota bacterium]